MGEIICVRCGKVADPFARRTDGPVCEDCDQQGGGQ